MRTYHLHHFIVSALRLLMVLTASVCSLQLAAQTYTCYSMTNNCGVAPWNVIGPTNICVGEPAVFQFQGYYGWHTVMGHSANFYQNQGQGSYQTAVPLIYPPYWQNCFTGDNPTTFAITFLTPGYHNIYPYCMAEFLAPNGQTTSWAPCTGTVYGIYVHPAPSTNFGPDTTLYWGDTLALTPQANQSSYAWQNGSTQPSQLVGAPGTYAVTVTNSAGCRAHDSITVNFVPLCNAPISLGADTSICNDASLGLNAGPGFSTYAWSTGASTSAILADQAGQ